MGEEIFVHDLLENTLYGLTNNRSIAFSIYGVLRILLHPLELYTFSLVPFQIADRGAKDQNVIARVAEQCVTVVAQEAAYLFRDVLVVDTDSPQPAADRALPLLFC